MIIIQNVLLFSLSLHIHSTIASIGHVWICFYEYWAILWLILTHLRMKKKTNTDSLLNETWFMPSEIWLENYRKHLAIVVSFSSQSMHSNVIALPCAPDSLTNVWILKWSIQYSKKKNAAVCFYRIWFNRRMRIIRLTLSWLFPVVRCDDNGTMATAFVTMSMSAAHITSISLLTPLFEK